MAGEQKEVEKIREWEERDRVQPLMKDPQNEMDRSGLKSWDWADASTQKHPPRQTSTDDS